MISFLVCHKEVNRFSPSRNPAEETPLAGPKEEGDLLPRPRSTRTNPSRLGLAQRGGLVRRGWLLSVFSSLVIGCVWLAPPLRAQFVYVTNETSNNVSAYSIGADGALTPVPGSPFAAGIQSYSVAVDPTGKFAYVPNFNSANVSAYSIGADGALTQLTGSPFAAGQIPISVAVDPTGKLAYVANSLSNNVSAYSIGADGSLTQLSTSPLAAGSFPNSVAVDPTGKLAYVANNGSNNVSAYSIGADGSLTQLSTSPFAAGSRPGSVAITPLVPFTSSFAELRIAKDSFDLKEYFSLGAHSLEIKPLIENVTLQIGAFSIMIPAGSFKETVAGRFAFAGVVNGVSLNVEIKPLGNKNFRFAAVGTGVDLTGLTNPVTVVLRIVTNAGTTPVIAQF